MAERQNRQSFSRVRLAPAGWQAPPCTCADSAGGWRDRASRVILSEERRRRLQAGLLLFAMRCGRALLGAHFSAVTLAGRLQNGHRRERVTCT